MTLAEWLEMRGAPATMAYDARECTCPKRFTRAAARRPDWARLRWIAVLVGGRWCHRCLVARRRGAAEAFAEAMIASPEWIDAFQDLASERKEPW